MSKLPKNQHGFSAFEVFIIILVVVVIAAVGWLAYNRHHSNTNHGNSPKLSNSMPAGTFASKNYTLNITDDGGNLGTANPYSLEVAFNDSWNPNPTCPLKQPGFTGKIDATNMTADSATITITQNREPYTPKPAGTYVDCGQGTTVAEPDTTDYTLNSAWLEAGSPTKTLTINGTPYTLHIDMSQYALTISNGSVVSGVIYFPVSVGALTSDPDGCMSIAQLDAYAQANGMELAETKYPGSAAVLNAGTTGMPGGPGGQKIYVLANDAFIKLSKQSGQKKSCSVQASDSVISGDSMVTNGSITVGAKIGG